MLVIAQFATILGHSSHSIAAPFVGAAVGLYFFIRGFLLFQRKRLIQNTPSSKIRSASLGLVEVSGLATGPYLMNAPITGVSCYCYRTVAWQEKQSGKNKEWRIVAEENLHVPFFLDDNTGRMLIDPRGAELDLHCDFKREFSDSLFTTDEPVPGSVRTFVARHGVSTDNKVRVEEYCIKPKNALFILGTLAENPGLAVAPTPIVTHENRTPFGGMTSSLSNSFSFSLNLGTIRDPKSTVEREQDVPPEVINLSARQSSPGSAATMTQQGKIAAALQRAGISNPAAWSAAGVPFQPVGARSAPIESLSKSLPEISASHLESEFIGGAASRNGSTDILQTSALTQSPLSSFDFRPPVILMKGTNNPAFLISWRNQREVVSAMNWKSTLMIWGGPALTLFSLWLLAAEFGWL